MFESSRITLTFHETILFNSDAVLDLVGHGADACFTGLLGKLVPIWVEGCNCLRFLVEVSHTVNLACLPYL